VLQKLSKETLQEQLALCEKNQKTQEYLQFREGIHSEEAGTHTIRTG